MPSVFSIAFAETRSRRFTTALTVIAIMLGTAVVVATFATNVAVEDSMSSAARALVGDADILVDAVDDAGFAVDRANDVATLPGVTAVSPYARKRVFFRTAAQRGFVEILGIDPIVDPSVHPYTFTAGRFFTATDREAVLVTKEWAATYGLAPGGRIELITADGFRPFTVAGVLEEADLSQRGGAGVVRVPLAEAQSAFGLGGRVQSLAIKVADASQVAPVTARLESVLPYVFVARTAKDVFDDLRGSIRDFATALYFFGAVALLAGAILVFNTLSLTVVARRQQIGLLRAIGARSGTIARFMLAQGLIMGIAGAALGLVLGQILSIGLAVFVARTQGLSVSAFPFSPVGDLVALLLGVGVTLVATLLPALRAGRTPPSAAMNASRARSASGRRGPHQMVVVALAGLGATLIGRFAPSTALLARRTVQRESGQTMATVASFVIGLGLIVALAGGAASFSSAGEQWAQSLFPGSLVVVSPIDEPLELLGDFEAIPGVDQVSPVSQRQVAWNGVRLTAVGVDPSHYFQAFQLTDGERTAAFKQMRRGDGVLVPQAFAREMELKVGDPVRLSVNGLDGDFVIAGIVAHSFPSPDGFGALIVPRDAMEGLFGVGTFRFLVVSAAPDADLPALTRELQAAAETYGMRAATQAQLSDAVGGSVNAVLAPLAGLVAIAVIVGALGLANTMALNIGQRVREIGILRASGMRSSGVRGLAIAEAGILGLLGALVGVALGAALTFALVQLSRSADIDARFAFSIPLAVGVIAAGVIIAVFAALYPARIAARIDILQALRQR